MIQNYVRLWLDDAALGCGSRAVIVHDVGHKLARLVEPATGRRTTIEKDLLRHAAPIEPVPWHRLAVDLDRARRAIRLHGGVRTPPAVLKQLAAECRALATHQSAAA